MSDKSSRNMFNMRVRDPNARDLRALAERFQAETGFALSLSKVAERCLAEGLKSLSARPALMIDLSPEVEATK